MKRDWDVVRRILTVLEAQPVAEFELYPQDFEPIDPERAAFHLRLLREGGFIEGSVRQSIGVQPAYSVIATRLTMAGHDLLATMNSQTLWARVRELARERSFALTADTIKALAAHALKSLL